MSGQLDEELIARSKLFGNPTRLMAQISPDGEYIGWLAPSDGVMNVWIAPADDLPAARLVTQDKGRGIQFFGFAKTNRHMLYLQDAAGNENFHLYCVGIDGGEVTDLTPYESIQARPLASSWNQPEKLIVAINDRDQAWHDLYAIDLIEGTREKLLTNDSGYNSYLFDGDLNLTLVSRSLPDGGGEVLRYSKHGTSPLLTIGHEDYLTSGVNSVTSDGSTAYALSSIGRNTAALYRIDLQTGMQTQLGEHDVADITTIMTHPVSGEIQAYGANYLKLQWTALEERTGTDLAHLSAHLPGEISVVSRTKSDDKWVIASHGAAAPAVYYLYDRDTRALERLFAARPDLNEAPLVKMHPCMICSRDHLAMVSYLSLPPSEEKARPVAPLPMVLLVHGGPWARDTYGYQPQHQWLANRGYAVLSVNFRGSTGFGKSFINAGDREWGAKMHDDLLDAVAWAIDEGIAQADRIAIMGGSYGGYATLAGLAFTPEVFCCGVDIVGPSNLETLMSTVPAYWKTFYENLARRVGDPRTPEGRELLRARSPVHAAARIARPLLIGQGANDPRVKQAESDQIVTAMQENGLAVAYILYSDEGHGFVRPENRLSFYAIAEAFLAEHMGGRAEAFGSDLEGASLSVPQGVETIAGLQDALAKQ